MALPACLALVAPGPRASEEARLLRFPAIHGKQIVFSHAGDLYTVASTGGVARRLTSDVGYEMFPRFSPDGKWIAFTGQYDGNTEVFLMPAEGGVPRRLTYTATLDRDDVSDRMGPNNIVMTWRDDQTIIFRSRRADWNPFNGHLLAASIDGGLPNPLPLPRGGWCSYSPDRKRLAYNRVFREFRTWKRYRGGQADDIWIYDFEKQTTENITSNAAQDIFPMWFKNRIYFLSDRDERKKLNLYAFDLDRKTTTQVTTFTEFDVKFPSLGDDAIVFENGGYLYRLDLATDRSQKVSVFLEEDFALARGGLKDVSKQITSYALAPDGSRALFGARGEVFTVPAKHGPTRNLTRTSGVHERDPVWSPDGKWIACVSDGSGEDELYLIPQDGSAPATQLTTNADTYKYHPVWSPDSKKLLWSDKKQRLQFVEVEGKQVTRVDQATVWEINDYVWSPDSRWIAFVRPEEASLSRLALYSVESKEWRPVTDGWFASHDPAFSADGKYLFFVSERDYTPRFAQLEPNHAYFDMSRIYLVSLARETRSPFEPQSNEVKIKTEDKPDAHKDEGKEEKKEAKPVVLKVDWEGLAQRIAVLPVSPSSYDHLVSVGDKLYYTRQGTRDEKRKLFLFELEKEKLKETELGEFAGYEVSADGKKMLVNAGESSFALVDLPTGKVDVKEKLDLGDLKVALDRPAEWNQIYRECWRQMRDFMFATNLHGVDWERMRQRYEPLLAHVHHRADLTYVIGELISELNIGHAYVGGGDYPKPERIPTGLLGATLERDPASGYFLIRRILRGQNWDKRLRSPLTEIGVDAREGDYILAVDGLPANQQRDLYALLVNRAGKQVRLRLNTQPRLEGSRETVVVPTGDERPLYYLGWVERNLERVSRATDGKVGYVHIPDMGEAGLNEFVKYYYPQTRKEGLIVDVRFNGGGFVSQQIIERLRREWAMITVARNASINLDPGGMVLGPKVMLLNEFSASDGDIVAYRFRQYKLGPVIGKRSWGGVVGIRGSLPLLDGGFLNRPEFSRYDIEGKEWIMEGKGVEPDIVIDNDPAREFAGSDDQLEKAIDVIKQELARHPVVLPPPPPLPDKSK
jgi:tricorn protease